MHRSIERTIVWTARRRFTALLLGVGAATVAAACAGGGTTTTSPSGVTPVNANVRPATPGVVRNFSVTISPASLTVGAGTLTVTVTNNATTSASQALGSVEIVVPSGLIVTSVGNFSSTTGKYWSSSWSSGQTVIAGAATKPGGGPGSGDGLQKLDPGESVTFDIGVVTVLCQTNTFDTPMGSSETLAGTFSSNWTYTGSPLSVSVTACSLDCPAAPAVANAYLDTLGFTGGRGWLIRQVADHMTQGAYFDGISPCDLTAYRTAVLAFVNARLS